MSIPREEVEAWIQEQKKKGRTVTKMGDNIAVFERTLMEQMDFKRTILQQIENCQFACMYSEEAFGRAVAVLVAMIPTDDQDDAFKEEIADSKIIVHSSYDKRVKYFQWNYPKIFRSCIDLFRRRGLLWGETQREMF